MAVFKDPSGRRPGPITRKEYPPVTTPYGVVSSADFYGLQQQYPQGIPGPELEKVAQSPVQEAPQQVINTYQAEIESITAKQAEQQRLIETERARIASLGQVQAQQVMEGYRRSQELRNTEIEYLRRLAQAEANIQRTESLINQGYTVTDEQRYSEYKQSVSDAKEFIKSITGTELEPFVKISKGQIGIDVAAAIKGGVSESTLSQAGISQIIIQKAKRNISAQQTARSVDIAVRKSIQGDESQFRQTHTQLPDNRHHQSQCPIPRSHLRNRRKRALRRQLPTVMPLRRQSASRRSCNNSRPHSRNGKCSQ